MVNFKLLARTLQCPVRFPLSALIMSNSLRIAIAPPPVPRNYAGIAIVVVLHILLGYAIANGLGRKFVEVLKKPLDVALIEEIKPPPPPPPKPAQVPKASNVPPPAYVPPAEVAVQAPPPVITATTAVPPPEPPAPVVKVAPAEPINVAVACPNHLDVRSHVPYPPRALTMALTGDVLVEFVVAADGDIKNVQIVQSSNAVFNRAATDAIARFKCIGQGRDARVRVPFAFRLDS